LVKGFSLFMLSLCMKKGSQIMERYCSVRMTRPKYLFFNRKGLLIEILGLLIPVLSLMKDSQCMQSRRWEADLSRTSIRDEQTVLWRLAFPGCG
jgi:hypothetical protein